MSLQHLEDALNAVRAAPAGSLKLSRTVAYALGDGDPISRMNYERYGVDMHPPGQPKKGSGWFPAPYTENLDAAGKPLPAGWFVQSGTTADIDADAVFFAIACHPGHGECRETAATEPLARIAVVLRARIIDGVNSLDLEALLS